MLGKKDTGMSCLWTTPQQIRWAKLKCQKAIPFQRNEFMFSNHHFRGAVSKAHWPMFHSSIPPPQKRVKSVVFSMDKKWSIPWEPVTYVTKWVSVTRIPPTGWGGTTASSKFTGWLCPFSAKFLGYLKVSQKQCKEWMLFEGHVLVWNGLNSANPETLTCLVLVHVVMEIKIQKWPLTLTPNRVTTT